MQENNLQDSEDSLLLLQLSEGNNLAFDALYDKYFKQVFNSAFKRLNDRQQAEDIAQDVFVQLWIRGSKTPIENLPAYLHTVVRNNVFKLLEKESKYTTLPDLTAQLEDPRANADSVLLHHEFLKAFGELVNSLPEQQRIIFKMRFDEDLSSAEIAEKLQISPKTVRNQLGKSLSRLKDSMLLVYIFHFLLSK